jgi:putative mycofactocin binding protein MftB
MSALTLDSACTLHPQVALRPEPFGALAYHYGNRRLIFLKHPDVVSVVKALGEHPSVGETFRACGIDETRQPTFLAALEQLTKSEILSVR